MKSAIILLFICAFSFGLVNAQPFREEGKMRHKNMLEKLNLSDEQQEKIQTLRLNHSKEMIDLKADLEKAELALNELKTGKNFSRNDYLNAVEKINAAKNKISVSRANHMMDIYDMLTDKQKEEFREFGPGFRMEHDGHGFMNRMRDWD